MPVYKSKEKAKDGRQWYYSKSITINGKTKRIKSKLYATKREAEKAESLLLINANIEKAEKITFGQVAEVFLQQKQQVMKVTGYKKLKQQVDHVLSTLNDVVVENMTIYDYQQLRKYLDNKDFSIAYKNKMLITLDTLCSFCQRYYNISTNIPSKFERYQDKSTIKKEMNYYTLAEFRQFISVIDDNRFKAFFTILFYCGLRCGEANALQWSDIDFEKRELKVTKTITTKLRDSGSNYLLTSPKTKSSIRTLPIAKMPLQALKTLYEQYSKYPNFSNDWFVFGGMTALPESTIQSAKNRYVKLAKVKNIRVHDFRHSCASLLINNGANITLVSKYLGHSDISMTLNTYSHFYKSKMDELIETLDELDE